MRNVLDDLKLASIYKLLRKGNVRVNGKRVRDGAHRLSMGDILEVSYMGDASKLKRLDESRELVPQDMPLTILYENDKLVAIDKPAGISVHPGKGVQIITLVEGLLAYGKTKGFEPRPVHRLDKHTSGVILFAKSPAAAREIANLFKERKVDKVYHTLLKGVPAVKSGKITVERDGYTESLEYRLIREFEEVSLAEIKLLTGKKHQIRRQMAEMRHPVVGDDVYGEREFNRTFKKEHGLKRYFLHCSHLGLTLDSKERLEFDSPLPADLKKVLSDLE